jgi:hypothetical protein
MTARRRADASASSILALRLTPDERARLDATAEAAGVKPCDLLREWIAGGGPTPEPPPSRVEEPPPVAPPTLVTARPWVGRLAGRRSL